MARKKRRSSNSPLDFKLLLIMLACFCAGAAAMWGFDQARIADKDKQIDDLRIELTIATGKDPAAL